MFRARIALLSAICLVAACAMLKPSVRSPYGRRGWGGQRIWEMSGAGGGPSYAIFPTQHLPLRFSHAQHLNLGGIECTRCHQTAISSTSPADRLVPSEQACTPCHMIDRNEPTKASVPSARCDACHPGFDPRDPVRVARVNIPAANLKFSHRAHLSRGARCENCHGDLSTVTLATRLELPTMQKCLQCHRQGGEAARAECSVCHLVAPDGVLQTHFAEGWLNPPEWMPGLHHDADFWVNHRTVAAGNGARCEVCHRESDCVECHDGRVRDRRTHPNDYVTLHPVEARQAPERCQSCHRVSSFCETCHLRMGVAESSAVAARALGRFHPPPEQWSGPVVSSRHHAVEARRALTACVSCHTERDCTSCHASTGIGGGGINPHPPGWLGRCGPLLRAAPRACAQCHQDMGTLAAQCR